MAKVTHNSDKEANVKTFKGMAQGEIGMILESQHCEGLNHYAGIFVMRLYNDKTVSLSSGSTWDKEADLKVRILRPDESITLRNER